jgi:hypothetical protein
MRRAFACVALLALAGCAGVTPPSQPSPATIESTLTALASITADPVTAYQAGNYEVRAACHAYLNAAASRSANISLASGGLGLAGTAAAGFLVAGANPGGAAAAGVLAALGQNFLGLFQQAGAIPYGAGTSTIIENALDAYEAGVAASPPTSVAMAASFTDDEWYLCSPGGYAELMEKAAMTAGVSTSAAGPAMSRALSVPMPPRPVIRINGS